MLVLQDSYILGIIIVFLVSARIGMVIVHVCVINGVKGRRRGMQRGIPNHLMLSNNRAARVDVSLLPSVSEAKREYIEIGGRLSEPMMFGVDPLGCFPEKYELREANFRLKYPSFEPMFNTVCNGHFSLFCAALIYLIQLTKRLASMQ